MNNVNNIIKVQNIKLQLQNLESQFDNLEIQMNNLMMGWKIENQLENLGIQLLNLGIQTFNLYKQMPVLRTTEEENNFNQNIANITQQIKNLSFPEKMFPINNIGNNIMNPDIMNMNQQMMNPMMMGGVMNPLPLGMNDNLMNNPMMNQTNIELDDDTGLSNPIFKLMQKQSDNELQNPIEQNLSDRESDKEELQDPLDKMIKIIFKKMNGEEKTKNYSYFKTKVCDMLRNYIMEENLELTTTFLFNGSKLSKLNQKYICDVLSDNSIILVLA